MPRVDGLLETALYVDDLEKAAHFYQKIFGFEALFADSRLCVLNVCGRHVLLLFKKGASSQPTELPGGGTIPPTDGDGNLHLAFAIGSGELPAWESWLAENGIAIESRVRWERGGTSLYFRDPDRHVVELATPGIWPIY